MNTKPLVSVIVPTYNRAHTLARAIASVLAQSFNDFELIVVDDGSTDNTKEIMARFHDARIQYVKIVHQGAAAARNKGIEMAQGDFVAFQDSDDEWLPEKLAAQVDMMRQSPPSVGVVYTGFTKITKSGAHKEYPPASLMRKEGALLVELLLDNFITTQAALVRISCLRAVGGFDERLYGMQDWELWIRIAKQWEFAYVPRKLVITHYSPFSISTDRKGRLKAKEIIFWKHRALFLRYPLIAMRHAYTIFRNKMLLLQTAFFLPFFYAAFPLLFLFAFNIEQTSLDNLFLPLTLALSGAGLFFSISFLLFKRSIVKAALFSAAFFLIFFAFGHVRNALENITLFGIDVGRDRHVLFGFGFMIAAIFGILFRMARSLDYVVRLLFILGLILIAFPLFSIASFEARTLWQNNERVVPQDNSLSKGDAISRDALPDVYYIILDGYAHESTLRRIYEFDNSAFIARMREYGFFIPAGSRANYAQTHLSLASALSMNYLPAFSEDAAPRKTTYPLIQKNAVARFLHGHGYRFIHISSGMVDMTNRNPYADLDFRNGRFNEFTMLTLESSALYPFVRQRIEAEERGRVFYSFETLMRMPDLEGPNFIFAHMLVPHPPFVFGPQGERIDDPQLRLYEKNPWVLKDHYRNQLLFTNKKTLETVDAILSQSKTLPIIIIQGDHGTASTGEGYKGLEGPTTTLAKERMKIFAAYYLPADQNGLPEISNIIPDEITPLNAFRRIFNAYFNAGFEILPDKSYLSSYEQPFILTDVTDKASGDY
ncbi:MAG: glycosyltransferase [Patescibacteria group bacterium]